MRKLTAIVLSLSALLITPITPSQAQSFPDLAVQGIRLVESQNFTEAESILRQALTKVDDDERFLAFKGDVLFALSRAVDYQGEHIEAEIFAKQAIQENPNSAQYRCRLSTALTNQGKDMEAESSYRDALGIDAGFENAIYGLGKLLEKRKAFLEAEVLYVKGSLANPKSSNIPAWHGEFLMNQNRLREAEFTLLKSLARNSKNEYSLLLLGLIYENKGDLDGAQKLYLNGLKGNPNSSHLQSALSRVTSEGGNFN